MQVLRGRSGYNLVVNGPSYSEVSDDDEQNDFEVELPSSNLFSASAEMEMSSLKDESEFNDDIEDQILNSDYDNEIFNDNDHEQQAYRSKYINRMKLDADVHFNRIQFACGDKVIISKDRDNNTAHRHNKFNGFYEEGTWTIVEKSSDNNFWVELDGKKILVSKNRLKKSISRKL